MKGHKTTFVGLFEPNEGGSTPISSIEIPIIQRDFAQGRPDDEATGIRERFITALVAAATTDSEMALDFIYGDVKTVSGVEHDVLRPLDGQQRLTTLFLLHWYVASLAGTLDPGMPWLRFSYSTRPSARDFGRALTKHPFPGGARTPSEWITDQPWYVYPWQQDPTIRSMLVMLDAIHAQFDHDTTDFDTVWSRLTDSARSAIWFLFLPVADQGQGEDLYIKMNSRGKPLTQFEVFKADLEGMLKPWLVGNPCPLEGLVHEHDRYDHLKQSIDGPWTDLLWEYEKSAESDYLIDAEFIRYLTFLIDVCEWRDGEPDRRWRDQAKSKEWPLEERARLALADSTNDHAARNRDFFFHAFDTWRRTNPADEMSRLFRAGERGDGPLRLLVASSPDLFGSCINKYGSEFSLADTMMLFAVLLARMEPRPTEEEVHRRLRTLRNLAESAFIDRKRMSEYIATTERLVVDGTLDGAQAFNVEWTADEQLKWSVMDAHPEVSGSLHLLEDLTVTRGRLLAFDLENVGALDRRASGFLAIAQPGLRDALGATLLTKGDYSREVGWEGKRRQLGSLTKDDSWRDLFTAGSRNSVERTRLSLMALLDDVAERMGKRGATPSEALESIRAEWLSDREARSHFDWRYYFARYQGARSSVGEGYFHNKGYDATNSFSYGRIRMLYGGNYNAYFGDALLRAAWLEGRLDEIAKEPKWWHKDDPGMTLLKSSIEIRCVDEGFELVDSDAEPNQEAWSSALGALHEFPGASGHQLLVGQMDHDGVSIDAEDRVQLCIQLTRALGTVTSL